MKTEEHATRFNRGAERYVTDRYPGRGQCMQKVLEMLDPQPFDAVLDVGCGPGSDTPSYVSVLEQVFTAAGLCPTTNILNPLVGVIVGRKTQQPDRTRLR